jgi:hypothetical protein
VIADLLKRTNACRILQPDFQTGKHVPRGRFQKTDKFELWQGSEDQTTADQTTYGSTVSMPMTMLSHRQMFN